MLRVRDEYQELSVYLAGRLIVEDAVWSTLAAAGRALSTEELAAALTGTTSVPGCFEHRRLSFILRQSRRFSREDSNSWSLAVWHLPYERPYLSKAEFILDSAGRALTASEMNSLIARCHRAQVDFSRMGVSYPRMFVCANSLWLLRYWLTGPPCDLDRVDPFDRMVEPCGDLLVDAGMGLEDVLVSLLAIARTPLSGYHLSWALRRMGIQFTDLELAERLTKDERVAIVAGHWTVRNVLSTILQDFADMSLRQWVACQRQLRTILKQASWEREFQGEVRNLARGAKEVLERKPMSLDDLITGDPGLAALLSRITSETERIGAFSMARSELSNSLLSDADILRLSDGTLMAFNKSKIEGIVRRLCEALSPMSTAEILAELCPDDYQTRTEASGALEKRLHKYNIIEKTHGFWHPSVENLRERITDSALDSLLKTTLQSNRPVPLSELARQLFATSAIPPDPLGKLLLEETRRKLRGLEQLWELEGDLWWAQPQSLASADRVEKASAAYDRRTGTLDEHTLYALAGLDISGVSAPDLEAIKSAFAEVFRRFIGGDRDGAPRSPSGARTGASNAREAGVHAQGTQAQMSATTRGIAHAPPCQSRCTLTEEGVSQGWMKLSPGMRRILKESLSSSATALETYGVHQIRVSVNCRANRLEGDDLRRWFAENRLEAGHIVYLLSPAAAGKPPRLYTKWEFQEQRNSHRSISRRSGVLLRDSVYSVLREKGHVMTVAEIVDALREKLGRVASESSIATTLRREHHLFSHWGRNRWALREWEGDWRERIDLQSLLMRIEEENLVVETLRVEGKWMKASEISQKIASRFSITVDIVIRLNVLNPRDPRLVSRGDLWGLREWSLSREDEEAMVSTQGTVGLVGGDKRMSLFLRPLDLYPEFKEAVSAWAVSCYGSPIDDLLKRVENPRTLPVISRRRAVCNRAIELAAQLVCVAAISVFISEAKESDANWTQAALKNVQLFREQLVRTNPRINGLLFRALYSEPVVKWLIDRLVSDASDSGPTAAQAAEKLLQEAGMVND